MSHYCACRLREPRSVGGYDVCREVVESDDEPFCASCTEHAEHHALDNFDPVPANLLHTLRVGEIDNHNGYAIRLPVLPPDLGTFTVRGSNG